MWQITTVTNPTGAQLWFSDGLPVLNQSRGGNGSSFRLIVEGQGFLDITELYLPRVNLLDFNGFIPAGQDTEERNDVINVSLTLPGNGSFSATLIKESHSEFRISGALKPLPTISKADAGFIDEMIQQKYVPYQHIPDPDPGKTIEELKKLGKQLFPFTPHSFELAMVIYDWTTASFARMEFNKVFEYTSIPPQPFPLDENSIALMIWNSNWPPYTPQNPDYMNSFMMKPASSLEDVQSQLTSVRDRLHKFSDVENRLIAAACQAMPRTSIIAKRQLYSGQVMNTLGLDHFGVEFLQCPLNAGPVGKTLIMAFATVMSSYVSEGHVITTKMVWSFADTIHDAIHYSNGILLVMNPPDDDSWVWETAAYATPLSDNPQKTEYLFPPGTSVLVQKVEQATVEGKQVVVINLQPVSSSPTVQMNEGTPRRDFKVPPLSVREYVKHAESYLPELEKQVEVISTEGGPQYKIPHKTGGRRCRCVDVAEGRIKIGEKKCE